MTRTLDTLEPGQGGTISLLNVGNGALFHRLSALGVRVGKTVEMVRCAHMSGPLQIRIGTTDLILRRYEASCIELYAAI
ncbi:MAG: ferrous iron transport protein A [Ottowia sp.]|jgi:ferrous iron transport protein A|nr:ferrous iron transport protein A [Ottowia sp.]